MAGVQIEIHPQFYKRIKKRYEGHQMEVGILQDKPHYDPVYVSPLGHSEKTSKKGNITRIDNPFKTLAGGLARKQSQTSDKTVAQVFIEVQEKTGVNILKDPFKAKGNLDLLKLVENFFKFVTSKNYLTGSPTKAANQRRLENAVQALVRNPITRGEYGSNKRGTAAAKGFNRLLIDTGQVFQNIKARVIRAKGVK